jgi:hypothetical protein
MIGSAQACSPASSRLFVGVLHRCKGACRLQLRAIDKVAREDFVQKRGLLRFEKHQAAQHVQKIEQIACIFRKPVIGLDEASVAKRACSLRSSSIWN